MQKSLSAFGKLTGSSAATTDGSHTHSRLFIYDKFSVLIFLVDSGSAVSWFLKRLASASEISGICLYAENGSQIRTLVLKQLELESGCVLDSLSDSEEHHRLDLDRGLLRLSDFGLLINLNKCVFGASKGHFLGYLISKDCIKTVPEKVKALLDFSLPKFVELLCRVLAMIKFYHKFLKDAAKMQSCLNDLTKRKSKKDKTPLFWTENEKTAFKKVKKEIADASFLAHPLPDAKLSLVVDASDFVSGAVLQQIQEIQPLFFFT
ncbi:hypothetical protein AVEN_78125-1 [Araneus ventricosus]|uniref:Reverse transcriptase/retrotransposon-derived protein RNase H-like domain-containing protein n=1 Tax=Araneus ventricosus TaxID=182803 RepID=A0A4Y2KW88_ARAVE|nr:hypothetical protein AVEN_78125-1 [Araneus ventricosus]